MTLFSAILYTFSFMTIAMLSASYFIAFRMKPRLHVLAFGFFFLSVLLIISVTVVKAWGVVILGSHVTTPEILVLLRPLFLFITSNILLYTTWKKQK